MLGSNSGASKRTRGVEVLLAIRFRQDAKKPNLFLRRFEECLTTKAYDASSGAFQMLVCYVVNDNIAKKVLLSLLRCCSTFQTSDPGAESVLELLTGFGKQLQRFAHLDLWKAYMLMLLANAALVSNCTPARLIGLRTIMGAVPFTSTVPLDEVPDNCSSLVKCGRAFLVSLDVKNGVSLSDIGLLGAFQMAEMLMETSMPAGVKCFIRGAFDIIKLALDRDHLVYTTQCYDSTLKIVEWIFKFYDSELLEDDLACSTLNLWGKVPSLFSFDEAIKAAEFLITEHVLSKNFYLLLTIPKVYVEHKWPKEKENHESTFPLLRDMVTLLIKLTIYPGSDETSQLFLTACTRGVHEQLRMVASVVYLYLCVMFRDGETNHTGLFAAEELEQTHVWLTELYTQANEVKIDFSDPAISITRSSVLAYLAYALQATKDPKFILENGLPFEL